MGRAGFRAALRYYEMPPDFSLQHLERAAELLQTLETKLRSERDL